jgi:hypothetical protein
MIEGDNPGVGRCKQMSNPDTVTAQQNGAREGELRLAHQRAFERIRSAGSKQDYRATVAQAMEELVAACEAYTYARANADRQGKPASG